MIKTPAKKIIFLFIEATVFSKGKPTIFGAAFDREPGFKTENLIKPWAKCRHFGGACVRVCERAITKDCATLFWATLNLLYYWKQCSLLITRSMSRLWAKLITHFNKIVCCWWGVIRKFRQKLHQVCWKYTKIV